MLCKFPLNGWVNYSGVLIHADLFRLINGKYRLWVASPHLLMKFKIKCFFTGAGSLKTNSSKHLSRMAQVPKLASIFHKK
jgi:hypothetical protein